MDIIKTAETIENKLFPRILAVRWKVETRGVEPLVISTKSLYFTRFLLSEGTLRGHFF